MTEQEYLAIFIQQYKVAALWAETTRTDEPFDLDHTVDDFDSSAEAKILEDCTKFFQENKTDLLSLDPEQCGHDFWLNRNGHGAGFWSRGYEKALSDRLSDACHKFRECHLTSENGKVYID